MRVDFRNSYIWAWNWTIRISSRSLHIYLVLSFYTRGSKLSLVVPMAAVSKIDRPIFEIVKLEHKTWQQLHGHTVSFYPRGSKLRLPVYSLYGQRFLGYGLISKIAIFGHKNWSLAKVHEVTHIAFSYPSGMTWN